MSKAAKPPKWEELQIVDSDAASARDPNDLRIAATGDHKPEYYEAATAESPIVRGAMTGIAYSRSIQRKNVDITAYAGLLDGRAAQVREGDLSGVETMLTTQANTLDAIFNHFALKASGAQYISQAEAYLRIALKAQSQCRSTVEAIGELKNPRSVAFIKQQNNAAGHQQVNNGTAPVASQTEGMSASVAPRAHGKQRAVTNELLEHDHGKRMDAGAARTPGGGDQAVETLGAVDGAADGPRQGRVSRKLDKARPAVTRVDQDAQADQ